MHWCPFMWLRLTSINFSCVCKHCILGIALTHHISVIYIYIYIYKGWNDKIVVLKKTTLQLYSKSFIENINSDYLVM